MLREHSTSPLPFVHPLFLMRQWLIHMLTGLAVPILVVLHPAIPFILVYNLVSWSAKKQSTVSRSNCEFEYHVLVVTVAELLQLMHLLHDLKIPTLHQLLLCNNKTAIFYSYNPIFHQRTKHVELDYHFLREYVVAGKLCTQYVPSHLQIDDIFTKSVSSPLFEFFRSKFHVTLLGMHSFYTRVLQNP